jgi:hypothetical protein
MTIIYVKSNLFYAQSTLGSAGWDQPLIWPLLDTLDGPGKAAFDDSSYKLGVRGPEGVDTVMHYFY